jgi:hypothetical protein
VRDQVSHPYSTTGRITDNKQIETDYMFMEFYNAYYYSTFCKRYEFTVNSFFTLYDIVSKGLAEFVAQVPVLSV